MLSKPPQNQATLREFVSGASPGPGLAGQGRAVNGRRLYPVGAPSTPLGLSHPGHRLSDGEGRERQPPGRKEESLWT